MGMSEQISILILALNGNQTVYVPVNHPCQLVDATSVIETTITTNETVLTFSDAITDSGKITLGTDAAGTIDKMTDFVGVELNRDTPLRIVVSGSPGAGAVRVTFQLSEAHASG